MESAIAYPVPKPRWRGRLHQIAFFVSIPQGLALALFAGDEIARLSASVYAFTLTGLYAVSSSYHRLTWTPRALLRMRKLDHSMIYLLIAGTYTPVSLLVLDTTWSKVLLGIVWFGAVVGICLKLVGMERTRRIGGALYIILGWIAVLAAPQLVPKLGALVVALIAAGGVLYTGGAVVLWQRRPDPNPEVFGYHEIWHVMVVAASICHYVAIAILIAR